MGSELVVVLIMFGGMIALLGLGVHVAWAIGGTTIIAILLFWNFGSLVSFVMATYGVMLGLFFAAIPLFVFMGVILERSGIGDRLFEMFYVWSGPLRGGLAVGTVLVCAIFAAMTGLTGAACITMGLVALPAMLKRGYSKDLALGTVLAPSTLGILIPPSVYMIMLGLIGKVSVGKLFFAGMVPGLLMTLLFIIYIIVRGLLDPQSCPAIKERASLRQKFILLRAVILPLLVVVSVLGSIFFGIATPTESAAVGAFALIICTAIYRKLSWRLLHEAAIETFRISALSMWIIFCALAFTAVFTTLGGMVLIKNVVLALEISRWYVLIMIMLIVFILGMFVDPFAIVYLVGPFAFPIIKDLGFDPVWFGVLFVINITTSYITPPFGCNLFYLKAIAPAGVDMRDIYRSIWPFLGVMIAGLIVVMLFPQIALWLPSMMK